MYHLQFRTQQGLGEKAGIFIVPPDVTVEQVSPEVCMFHSAAACGAGGTARWFRAHIACVEDRSSIPSIFDRKAYHCL